MTRGAPGRPSSRTDYAERLARVIAHVHDHLAEDLSLERLAEVAHLSPYHWHRVYHAVYGEPIAATVRRLRLQRGAGYLATTSMAVSRIARLCGYPNAQSFTRAFGAAYGCSPAAYRSTGDHAALQRQPLAPDPGRWTVSVRDVPAVPVAGIDHRGPYLQIGKAFAQAHACLSQRGLLTASTRWLAIYFDDPSSVPASQLASRACLSVPDGSVVEAPLRAGTLGGGRCAVLRHRGPYASMHAAYRWLYGPWLQQSGHAVADRPVVEEYLNHPRDTPPDELLTDILLPLED